MKMLKGPAFWVGGVVGFVAAIVLIFGLSSLLNPKKDGDPLKLLTTIRSTHPSPLDLDFFDVLQLVGKPVVDMEHVQGDRRYSIQTFKSDWHFFEFVRDESGAVVYVNYFTGGARLSQKQVFVFDRDQYEWLMMESSLVVMPTND